MIPAPTLSPRDVRAGPPWKDPGHPGMSHEALSKVPFEELLRRARAGDMRALDELFRRSQRRVGKWAGQLRASPSPGGVRPSDIAQDVAMLASRAFSQFEESTEGQWFAWLKQILRNHKAEAARAAHREKREPPGILSLDTTEAEGAVSPETSPSQLTARQQEWHRLFVCIYQLPDDSREAIVLCHLQDLSIAEAARLMGKTKKSVEGLLARGWQRVKERMRTELRPGNAEDPTPAPLSDAETALLDWLQRRDASEKVDPAAFLAEHPTCADELRDMLHWMERLQAHRPKRPTK
jgi:RNA polymerase sigma-70 factor (ECF subfamily)